MFFVCGFLFVLPLNTYLMNCLQNEAKERSTEKGKVDMILALRKD